MSDEPSPAPPPGEPSRTGTRPAARSTPNYAARRMLVTTAAIVAIVAFGVVGWTVVRSDDSPVGGGAGTWSELAVVDRATGAIQILDDDGEVDRAIVGRGRVTEVHTFGNRLALVGPNQIVIEGGDEPVVIPIDRDVEVTPLRTTDGLDLVIGAPAGGNVQIVDVVSGEMLDIGALASAAEPQIFAAPRMFAETLRWSSDGRVFAVADASSFQTILVREGSTDVSFFRSQPVAVSDDRVATSQIVGGQSDLELYDHERESKARVPLPIPAGGAIVDGELLVVTTDGGVYRISEGDREADRIERIDLSGADTVASVRPVADGDRLVVTGGAFEAVIDLDGVTLFSTTFTSPVVPLAGDPGWDCVPIGGGETFHSLVAAEDGLRLVDLSGAIVRGTASDGCTVLVERDGLFDVVGPDGSVALGRARSAVIGPDGRTVVRTTTTGATELLSIDDDLAIGDVIDLDEVAPRNALVAFLS